MGESSGSKCNANVNSPDSWEWLIHKIQKHYSWVTDQEFKKLSILRVFQMYKCAVYEEKQAQANQLYGHGLTAWMTLNGIEGAQKSSLKTFMYDYGIWERPSKEEAMASHQAEIDHAYKNINTIGKSWGIENLDKILKESVSVISIVDKPKQPSLEQLVIERELQRENAKK